MPMLVVVPADVAAVINGRGLNFDLFKDLNCMLKHLSAADVADIVIASNDFPFDLGSVLTINMEQMLQSQILETEEHEAWSKRYRSRYETAMLQHAAAVDRFVPAYQLYCVDEALWVAVQQKQHIEEGDPQRLLLKANTAFFDAVLANTLHTQSFESVCSTNLFTLYLESL